MLEENQKIPTDLSGVLVTEEHVSRVLEDKDISSCETVDLTDLSKDKILILYFYPKDNTPGCTIEANQFNEKKVEFDTLNAIIVGCSRDNEKAHCKFIRGQGLYFPLLFDNTGYITKKFGVWKQKSMFGKKYMGIDRVTFIIKNGIILKVYTKVSVRKHADEVLDYLKSLKDI